MIGPDPATELSAFSSDGAEPTAWEQGRAKLADAELYWLSTVRPDGRPHVTPLLGVWLDGAMYFCTGPVERKTHNLAHNPRCILLTGSNTIDDGLDVVVEGKAVSVSEQVERERIADDYESKYGAHFAPGGTWSGLGDAIRAGNAILYRLAPVKAFGFGKGQHHFSQTVWRFPISGPGARRHRDDRHAQL
jgi:nitroimidazol reductase NimA-like FMN-containing flavoprotein (pyridoxamine 5'-phosphate oxidase superfamily)